MRSQASSRFLGYALKKRELMSMVFLLKTQNGSLILTKNIRDVPKRGLYKILDHWSSKQENCEIVKVYRSVKGHDDNRMSPSKLDPGTEKGL
jgi:hypothetical protein